MASFKLNYTAQDINTRLGKVSTLDSDVTELNNTTQKLENKDIELENKITDINENILPSIGSDISDLSNRITNLENNPAIQDIDIDWNETNPNSNNYIANKPPVANGNGNKSMVVGLGDANGQYSIAGGTNDKSLIANIIGDAAALLIPTPDKAKANGDISMSFGAGTVSHTAGSMALGINSTAGVLGYYIWNISEDDFDYDLSGTVLTLSLNQRTFTNSRVIPTKLEWKVGDKLSIVNGSAYPLCCTITGVSKEGKKISVNSLPFNSLETGSFLDPLLPEDFSVIVADKPNSGEVAFGYASYAHGYECKATGSLSTAIGYQNTAIHTASFVTGRENTGVFGSLVGGYKNTVTGTSSSATGSNNIVSGDYSHAEGYETVASGHSSHAEGHGTTASGESSHAEGLNTTASGIRSHAEGSVTTASGTCSHSQGGETIASGSYSHAEGFKTEAIGSRAHAEGHRSIAAGDWQHVEGKFNIIDNESKYVHIVGNGAGENSRSNAHTLDWSGNAQYAGNVFANNIGPKKVLTNLIKEENITIGKLYDRNKDTWDTNADYDTVLIPCKAGETFYTAYLEKVWYSDKGLTLVYLDKDKKYVSGQYTTLPIPSVFTVPDNESIEYMYYIIRHQWKDYVAVYKSNEEVDLILPYSQGNAVIKDHDTQWTGKKWYAYGTSITDDAIDSDGKQTGKYTKYLAELSGMILTNRGIGSQGITNIEGSTAFEYNTGEVKNRIMTLDDNKGEADLITLEVGANDVVTGEHIGNFWDTGDTTFCGCLNQCIQYLQENTNAQILIIPSSYSKTGNKNGANITKAIEECCRYNCVAYVEPEHNMGIRKVNAKSKYLVDSIHHSELGGYIYASSIWTKLKTMPLFY